MHRERRSLAALARTVTLLLFATGAAHAQPRQGRPLPAFQARTVEFAREGARVLLRSPECRRLLTDFRDERGQTLAANLEPFALSPDEYLARIPFLDGDGHPLCAAGRSQLLSAPGVSRVFVCNAFFRTVQREREEAEVYVIHEMLHTLGLGENPPSSQEITQQVRRRCAP